jgi:hypothetical protein
MNIFKKQLIFQAIDSFIMKFYGQYRDLFKKELINTLKNEKLRKERLSKH